MLVAQSRPRTLRWFHAGPLLYGDWGTSRLYVMGLAIFFAGHGSVVYLAAIGILMAFVAWAYTIVCRLFPDGGGVYTAARQVHPTLALIGTTLLLCGYIMTAAISVVEALHYFGVPEGPGGLYILLFSILIIFLIGTINWLGARSAGRLALVIAFAALGFSAVIALVSVRYIPDGLRRIDIGPIVNNPGQSWVVFTKLCLALAGVEAVANMTGLMKKPVERTAKRTIWPVWAEVVALNLLFCIAFMGMASMAEMTRPLADIAQETGVLTQEARNVRDISMKLLAIEAGQGVFGENVGYIFGKASAIVFGLLLLSATNTAVMAMVSVLYSMAQDEELPRPLAKLNYSGVPWIGLIVSCVISVAVLVFERDPQRLGELYIIGVCGAITTNVLCCAWNKQLDIRPRQRLGMWALGLFLAAITLTIAITKPHATGFAATVIAAVLVTRQISKARKAPEPLAEPESGWLSEVKRDPVSLDPNKPRIMLAARGRDQAEYAVDLARKRNAILFVLFVRTLRVIDVQPNRVPQVDHDADAQESLGSAVLLGRRAGVTVVPIYVTSTDIADEILDYTVTFGCDTLIMGKSRRSLFSRTLAGDVVSRVGQHLPDGVDLITRAGRPGPGPVATAAEGAEMAGAGEGTKVGEAKAGEAGAKRNGAQPTARPDVRGNGDEDIPPPS